MEFKDIVPGRYWLTETTYNGSTRRLLDVHDVSADMKVLLTSCWGSTGWIYEFRDIRILLSAEIAAVTKKDAAEITSITTPTVY
jgi:hypothetical protein